MIKMSIIVAVYNTVPEFLEKCMQSLLNQTMKDIEILLIDDGSSSNCAKQCDLYAKLDNRVRVIHKKNEGVSVASNLGIQEAKGEFLTFVDHDDFIEPTMCEFTYKKIKELDVDALAFGYFSYTTNNTIRGIYKGEKEVVYEKNEIKKFLAQIIHLKALKTQQIGFAGANWGKVYNAEKLRKIGAEFPCGMQGGEDAVFTYCAMKGMDKIAYCDELLYYYRQNTVSFTKKFREDAIESQINHIDKLYSILNKDNEVEIAAWGMLCCDSLFSIGEFVFRPENKTNYLEKKSVFKETVNKWEFKSALSSIKSYNFSTKKKIILKMLELNFLDLFLFICGTLYLKQSKEKYD